MRIVTTAAHAGPWLIGFSVAVTFVLALGGFHPSNAQRDQEVRLCAAIVALASLPSAVVLGERLRRRAPAWQTIGAALRLLIPAAAAVVVLRFVGSINLEPRLILSDYTGEEGVAQAISARLPLGATAAQVRAFGAGHAMECSDLIDGVVHCSTPAPADHPLVSAKWLVRFTFAAESLVKVEVRKGLTGP